MLTLTSSLNCTDRKNNSRTHSNDALNLVGVVARKCGGSLCISRLSCRHPRSNNNLENRMLPPATRLPLVLAVTVVSLSFAITRTC
jgi:hypothetical protein